MAANVFSSNEAALPLEEMDQEVFLEQVRMRLGEFSTTRDATVENYWQAHVNGRTITMTLLDLHDKPTDIREEVDYGEMWSRFTHQPNYFLRKVPLNEDLLDDIVSLADNDFAAAPGVPAAGVEVNEEEVRSKFQEGMELLAEHDFEKAREIFGQMAVEVGAVAPKQKYIFNELGVELRKNGMFNEALQHLRCAVVKSRRDEHLWFNLGRVAHDAGREELAAKFMRKALDVNPDFTVAKAYLIKYLDQDETSLDLDIY